MDVVAAYVRRIFVSVTRSRKGTEHFSKPIKSKKQETRGDSEGSAPRDEPYAESENDEYPDVFDDYENEEFPTCRNNDIDSLQRGECIKIFPRSTGSSSQVSWSDDWTGIVDVVPTCRKVSVVSTVPSDHELDIWAPLDRKFSTFSDSIYSDVCSGSDSRKMSLISVMSDADVVFEDAHGELEPQVRAEVSAPAVFDAPSPQGAANTSESRDLNVPINDDKYHTSHELYHSEESCKHINTAGAETLISPGPEKEIEDGLSKHSPVLGNHETDPNDEQKRQFDYGDCDYGNSCDFSMAHSVAGSKNHGPGDIALPNECDSESTNMTSASVPNRHNILDLNNEPNRAKTLEPPTDGLQKNSIENGNALEIPSSSDKLHVMSENCIKDMANPATNHAPFPNISPSKETMTITSDQCCQLEGLTALTTKEPSDMTTVDDNIMFKPSTTTSPTPKHQLVSANDVICSQATNQSATDAVEHPSIPNHESSDFIGCETQSQPNKSINNNSVIFDHISNTLNTNTLQNDDTTSCDNTQRTRDIKDDKGVHDIECAQQITEPNLVQKAKHQEVPSREEASDKSIEAKNLQIPETRNDNSVLLDMLPDNKLLRNEYMKPGALSGYNCNNTDDDISKPIQSCVKKANSDNDVGEVVNGSEKLLLNCDKVAKTCDSISSDGAGAKSDNDTTCESAGDTTCVSGRNGILDANSSNDAIILPKSNARTDDKKINSTGNKNNDESDTTRNDVTTVCDNNKTVCDMKKRPIENHSNLNMGSYDIVNNDFMTEKVTIINPLPKDVKSPDTEFNSAEIEIISHEKKTGLIKIKSGENGIRLPEMPIKFSPVIAGISINYDTALAENEVQSSEIETEHTGNDTDLKNAISSTNANGQSDITGTQETEIEIALKEETVILDHLNIKEEKPSDTFSENELSIKTENISIDTRSKQTNYVIENHEKIDDSIHFTDSSSVLESQCSDTTETDKCENYYTLGIPLSLSGSDIVMTSCDAESDANPRRLSEGEESEEVEQNGDEEPCSSDSDDLVDGDDIIFMNFVSPAHGVVDLIPCHAAHLPSTNKKPELDYTCFFDDQQVDDEDSSSLESSADEDSSEEEFVNVMRNSKFKVLPVIYEDDAEPLHHERVSDDDDDERFEDAVSFDFAETADISERFKEYLIRKSTSVCLDSTHRTIKCDNVVKETIKRKSTLIHNDAELTHDLKVKEHLKKSGSNGLHTGSADDFMSKLFQVWSFLGVSRDVFRNTPFTDLHAVIQIQGRHLGLCPGKNLTPEAGRILSRTTLSQVRCVLEQVRGGILVH